MADKSVHDFEMELVKFQTQQDHLVDSVDKLKDDMKEGQDTLWYLSNASNPEQIGNLPILEGFKKRDWEVMLLTDAVDEWVTMTVQDYQETPVKSVSQGEFDDEEEELEDEVAYDEEASGMIEEEEDIDDMLRRRMY